MVEIVDKLAGKVILRNERWLKIEADEPRDTHIHYLLINEYTESLSLGENFIFKVSTIKQGNICYHIADGFRSIKIGFCKESDYLPFVPSVGVVFVKGESSYKIKAIINRTDGFSLGYEDNEWIELECEDITFTFEGKQALISKKNKLEID